MYIQTGPYGFSICFYAFYRNSTIGRDFVASDLPGSDVRVNISPSEILRLADRIIAKSKEVHDAVASVPLDKVL